MVPDKRPKPIAAISKDKKGCHFNREVVRMIKIMDKIRSSINHINVHIYQKK